MKGLRALLGRLVFDRTASIATLTALSVPLFFGMGGIAVDVAQWTLWKRTLQRTADSSALAGAHALAQGKAVADAATYDITHNDHMTFSVAPVVESPPSQGPYAGDTNAVRVVLSNSQRLPFSGLFMESPPLIQATGVAAVLSNGNYCVLALEEGTDTGVSFSGSTIADLGCGVASNSRGSTAVYAGGSSAVNATPIIGVGGVPPSNNYSQGTTLIPFSTPQPDPLDYLPLPSVPKPCANKQTVNPQQSVVLSPGCYRGMDIKGTASFDSGVYIIDGGDIKFGSQAYVTGQGVTFILSSKTAATDGSSVAKLDMNGGAYIDFTPPESGPYEGVLFYQDPRAADLEVNKINGNSSSRLEGAFYFPRQNLEFTGDSGMTTDCIQLISRRIEFTGNSAINNNCPVGNGAKSFSGTVIRLVG